MRLDDHNALGLHKIAHRPHGPGGALSGGLIRRGSAKKGVAWNN